VEKAEEARQRLINTQYTQLIRIEVRQINGSIIVLEGQVPSFFLKQVAQQVVLGMGGIILQNNLVVDAPPLIKHTS
jgi:hypothetical protein